MFRWEHVAALCLVAACTTVDNEPVADPTTGLDETAFRTKVEPILVQYCSYNACHGNPGSALRIYAPGTLRLLTYATIDEAMGPLTADEEHANFVNAAGFSVGAVVADNWLLRKPLPSSAGGFSHKGGAIYLRGTTDPKYTVIYCWLTGGKAC